MDGRDVEALVRGEESPAEAPAEEKPEVEERPEEETSAE